MAGTRHALTRAVAVALVVASALLAVQGDPATCPLNLAAINDADVGSCAGATPDTKACCSSMRILQASAIRNVSIPDLQSVVTNPSRNNACRRGATAVLSAKNVTINVFTRCSNWLVFPLVDAALTLNKCPVKTYVAVARAVSLRSLARQCKQCDLETTQGSSLCSTAIEAAAANVSTSRQLLNDCYRVITMRLLQSQFKHVFPAALLLCNVSAPSYVAAAPTAVPPPLPANATSPPPSNVTAPPPLVAAPSPAPTPVPTIAPNPLSTTPPAASPADFFLPAPQPSLAPSPAPAPEPAAAPAPSPSARNETVKLSPNKPPAAPQGNSAPHAIIVANYAAAIIVANIVLAIMASL